MIWVLWSFLLIIQNFSFTLVSRARNSGSILYHAITSVFSNGIWITSQFILIDSIVTVLKNADLQMGAVIGIFYTVNTIIGSLSAHWFTMKFIEPKISKTNGGKG